LPIKGSIHEITKEDWESMQQMLAYKCRRRSNVVFPHFVHTPFEKLKFIE